MPSWASWLLAAPQTICGAEPADDLVGERAAERARGVDVELGGDQRVGVGHGPYVGVLGPHRGDRGLVHVGDDDRRAVLDEVPDQVPADLADAGDADRAAVQRRARPRSVRPRRACPGRRRTP